MSTSNCLSFITKWSCCPYFIFFIHLNFIFIIIIFYACFFFIYFNLFQFFFYEYSINNNCFFSRYDRASYQFEDLTRSVSSIIVRAWLIKKKTLSIDSHTYTHIHIQQKNRQTDRHKNTQKLTHGCMHVS